MGRWKLLPIEKLCNFPLWTCTLSQQKFFISKGIKPTFENFPSPERCGWWVFWAETFKSAVILVCNGKVKTFSPSTNCEISHFQPVHCPSKNAITLKVFNWFLKTFLHVTDVEGGSLGWYLRCTGIFVLQWQRWKLLPIDKMWNFPLSTCTLSRQKYYIS